MNLPCHLKCAKAYAELEVCAKWHYFFLTTKKQQQHCRVQIHFSQG